MIHAAPGITRLLDKLEKAGLARRERTSPDRRQVFCFITPQGLDVLATLDEEMRKADEMAVGNLDDTQQRELVKLLENTFRHVNIALVNELAMFARSLHVDIWSAIDAAATKPYGFMRFTPGPGVGGHCLPVDPAYLAWRVEQESGERFRFVELANEVKLN